jgi:hypothetical protein
MQRASAGTNLKTLKLFGIMPLRLLPPALVQSVRQWISRDETFFEQC